MISLLEEIVVAGVTHNLIIAYNVLEILGILILSLILITAWLSSTIRRSTSWYLFLSSGAISSVTGLLLLGNQTNRAPSRGVCITQAILLYPTLML